MIDGIHVLELDLHLRVQRTPYVFCAHPVTTEQQNTNVAQRFAATIRRPLAVEMQRGMHDKPGRCAFTNNDAIHDKTQSRTRPSKRSGNCGFDNPPKLQLGMFKGHMRACEVRTVHLIRA